MGAIKTRKLIEYIVQSNDSLTVTSIIKLCYLIDLACFREFKSQVTDFKYIRWNYGPFDRTVYSVLEELEKGGTIESETVYNGQSEYVVFKSRAEVRGHDLDTSFTVKEKSVINGVLSDLQGYGSKLLTEIAYKTGPMQALGATRGGPEGMGEQLDLSKGA